MGIKLLHVVNDDKFIDSAYRIFDAVFSGANRFIIIGRPRKLKYIKKTPVEFIHRIKLFDRKFIASLSDYNAVLLHYLDKRKLELVSKAQKDTKFIWLGWGADYYGYIKGEHSILLKPLTQKMADKKTSVFSRWAHFRSKLFSSHQTQIQSIINKISIFSPVLREDYNLVKKSFTFFKPEYASWNYVTLEDDLLSGLADIQIKGNNILLGNSASYTNNHLDAFSILAGIELGDKKIIAPLSYGNEKYRDIVIKQGKNLFGDKFIPLVHFMPIAEYNKIISSCSVVFMNHLRQQAMGNIVAMMYLGAKIFLDPMNPVYDFFKSEGASCYPIGQLGKLIDIEFSTEEAIQNKKIIESYFSRKVILSKTLNIINIL